MTLTTGAAVRQLAGMRAAILLMAMTVLITGPFSASAQTTAYVTDQLEITLRSGQGNEYRIIRLLTSGTEVAVLERGETWSRVRAGGETGWVRSAYLQTQPVAASRLDAAVEEATALRRENRDLSRQLAQTEAALAELQQSSRQIEEENQRMQQRLQEADRGLTLADENQALRKQVVDLEREVQDLVRENERMAERDRRDWFIAGAGVIVLGMLLGILVTRIRWRRRSSWGDL